MQSIISVELVNGSYIMWFYRGTHRLEEQTAETYTSGTWLVPAFRWRKLFFIFNFLSGAQAHHIRPNPIRLTCLIRLTCRSCVSKSYHAPHLWNQLPVWVWATDPLSTFKNRLRTFLFDEDYS